MIPMNLIRNIPLEPGDIIQNKGSGTGYVVVSGGDVWAGDKVLVVRTIEVSNPSEWLLVRAACEMNPEPQ